MIIILPQISCQTFQTDNAVFSSFCILKREFVEVCLDSPYGGLCCWYVK